MTGLDRTGFERARLRDVKDQIEAQLLFEFGEDINLEPDSVLSQIVGIFADREAQLWRLAEDVYFSQYLASAEGVQLDNVARLVGLTRLAPSSSNVVVAFIGGEGVQVPAGTEVIVGSTGELFETLQRTSVTKNRVVITRVSVSEVIDLSAYNVLINGFLIGINSGAGATEQQILEDLRDEINNDSDVNESVEASIENSELVIEAIDGRTNFQFDIQDRLQIEEIGTGILTNSVNTGPVLAPIGAITEVGSPVAGLDEVTNLVSATLGNDLETDPDFRLRISQSLRVFGAATVESIIARLVQELDGVTRARVFENRTDEVDASGRPPHSFETLVIGGVETEIAEKLWELKPAGIETFGNIEEVIQDSSGFDQEIRFSRPVDVKIWFEVDVTIIPGEFPGDGTDAIKENLAEFAEETFGIGELILIQRFFRPIYQIEGVGNAVVRIARGESPDPGDYNADNIELDEIERPVFDASQIEVTLV